MLAALQCIETIPPWMKLHSSPFLLLLYLLFIFAAYLPENRVIDGQWTMDNGQWTILNKFVFGVIIGGYHGRKESII